jgi:hypothetical protein
LLVRAEYDPISSGCTLACVDLATGRERWRTGLEALGPVEHSEYENAVAMYLLDPGRVIIYGREAAGRYVEIVDVKTGRTVGHKRFAASGD